MTNVRKHVTNLTEQAVTGRENRLCRQCLHNLFSLPAPTPTTSFRGAIFGAKLFHVQHPTFSTAITLHTYSPVKMEQCSETLAFKLQTPGNNPQENISRYEMLSLSWAKWLHSTPLHLISKRSLLIFPPPRPRSSMLPFSFMLPDQNSAVYAVLFSLMCVTYPAQPIVLDSVTLILLLVEDKLWSDRSLKFLLRS
jgi:hypothetical protein